MRPTPPSPPLWIDERSFTDFVAEKIRRGSSLVPFVGSGLSAPSGIIMGQDFMNYLTWVVYRSVAKEKGEQEEDRLDLRKEGWPEAPNATMVEKARSWVAERFKDICEACKVTAKLNKPTGLVKSLEPKPSLIESKLRRPLVPKLLWSPDIEKEDNDLRSLLWSLKWKEIDRAYSSPPDVSVTSETYISECAIRVLHDWRCTLDFLSRLHVGDAPDGLSLWLENTDQTIIDSFNFFITHGRKPNLAHNMLCHLASRARIRCILTTNFDTLLEDAFFELGERFDIIPVGIHGALPAPGTVHAQNSIIKLHGALVDTRADVSLDERPADRDLESFFEYVRGKAPRPDRIKNRSATDAGFLPGLLLVCGYSASDLRCVQMIKYLLDADTNAKVLWVCHSQRDLENLSRIFSKQGYEFASEGSDWAKAQIIATVTDRTDLLFYELYQRLTLSLPRGGFNYQFSPNVPPHRHPRVRPPRSDPSRLVKGRGPDDSAARKLWRLLQQTANKKIPVVDGKAGVMEPMRTLFEYMTGTEQKKGIWLELEDYPDTASLAHEIFTIIALRLGRFQLDHARLIPPGQPDSKAWRGHIAALTRHWGIDPAEWFIVFYGRNGPGGAAGSEQVFWTNEGKGVEYDRFEMFLDALRTAQSEKPAKGFLILYAPYSQDRYDEDGNREKLTIEIEDDLRIRQQKWHVQQGTLAKLQGEWQPSDTRKEGAGDPESNPPGQSVSRYRVPARTIHQYQKKPDLFAPEVFDWPSSTQLKATLQTVSERWLMDNPDNGGGKVDRVVARRALYAATLFRQARHFSAFLSEGVYPCPCRYNITGIDNDWLRSRHAGEWLENWLDLRSDRIQSLFFHKPGGFAWAYHDTRLSVQRLIERMGPIEFVKGQGKKHAWEARARMHFWIGKWYARAYRATGHADPLLEALYHYAQCVEYSPRAMPLGSTLREDAPAYRIRLARRAVLQLTKTLRLGRQELRFWLQGGAGEPWFGEKAVNKLTKRFAEVFQELDAEAMAYRRWLTDLHWEMTRLPHNTEDETRELRFVESVEEFMVPPKRGYQTPCLTTFFPDRPRKGSLWFKQIRERWEKDLKSYEGMGDAFPTLMTAVNTRATGPNLAEDLDKRLKKWRDHVAWERDPPHLFVLAQATRELAYLFVLRAKREHHNCDADKALILPPRLAKRWVQACGLCWLTLDLCDELPASLLASETRLRIVACTLYGLALGRLGRFYEAHRRLNEAHAWLSRSKGMREPLDTALIKLRRAEVHIFEALRLRSILDRLSKKMTAPDWVGVLRDSSRVELEDELLNEWASMYLTTAADDPRRKNAKTNMLRVDPVTSVFEQFLQIHIAKLDDAWLALDGAQRALSGKSHSSLWWGHLHQLRLRVYATHWTPHENLGTKLPIALAFRKRRDHFAAVCGTYQAGLVASRADPYHAIRLADYLQQAVVRLTALGKADAKQASGFLDHVREHHFFPIAPKRKLKNSLLLSYRNAVEGHLA